MTYRKKPSWLRMPQRGSAQAARTRGVLGKYSLSTVCRQAMCPNQDHCFQRGTATFLILGERCTRNCSYCAIEGACGPLPPPDGDEPGRVAEASREMGLNYVVVTSVTRDDLPDGGAGHFAAVIAALRREIPEAGIEVLVPDFQGNRLSLKTIAEAGPDVFNHNIETVTGLFEEVRPGASYDLSLRILRDYGSMVNSPKVKSGLMLGMGETREQLIGALRDLRRAEVSMLTMGQYLQPSRRHWPVHRYLHPDEFEELRETALGMGFDSVASGPLVRSSFHADETYSDRAHI